MSLDAPELHASSDVRETISLLQTVPFSSTACSSLPFLLLFLTFLCLFSCSGVSSSHTCENASSPLVPVHSCCTRLLSNPSPPAVHPVWPWHMQLLNCSTTRLQACHRISSTQAFSRAVTPNETIEGLGILCGTKETSLIEIFADHAHID